MSQFCRKCDPYSDVETEFIEHLSPELCRDALKHEVIRLQRENLKLKKKIKQKGL